MYNSQNISTISKQLIIKQVTVDTAADKMVVSNDSSNTICKTNVEAPSTNQLNNSYVTKHFQIKHKLPIHSLPERDNYRAMQEVAKSNLLINNSNDSNFIVHNVSSSTSTKVQTEETFVITKEEYDLLHFCKTSGITIEDLKNVTKIKEEKINMEDVIDLSGDENEDHIYVYKNNKEQNSVIVNKVYDVITNKQELEIKSEEVNLKIDDVLTIVNKVLERLKSDILDVKPKQSDMATIAESSDIEESYKIKDASDKKEELTQVDNNCNKCSVIQAVESHPYHDIIESPYSQTSEQSIKKGTYNYSRNSDVPSFPDINNLPRYYNPLTLQLRHLNEQCTSGNPNQIFHSSPYFNSDHRAYDCNVSSGVLNEAEKINHQSVSVTKQKYKRKLPTYHSKNELSFYQKQNKLMMQHTKPVKHYSHQSAYEHQTLQNNGRRLPFNGSSSLEGRDSRRVNMEQSQIEQDIIMKQQHLVNERITQFETRQLQSGTYENNNLFRHEILEHQWRLEQDRLHKQTLIEQNRMKQFEEEQRRLEKHRIFQMELKHTLEQQKIREYEMQKRAWESQLSNYPNSDWSQTLV